MKTKKKIVLLIIFILIICIIYAIVSGVSQNMFFYIKRQMFGEPINKETGLINNNFFGISSDGKNPKQTRVGINDAIAYAYYNNISYIKLEKGFYLVDTFDDGDYNQRSIILKSNIDLDLNGSTIQIEANNETNYRILSTIGENNIKIKNGIIIGDRYQHSYKENSTNEWGMGVSVLGSKNVELINLQIKDTTGDGIYVGAIDGIFSENLIINNCNISNNRRQGISIINGKKIEIMNCEIYNINGTDPQSGICIECNNPESEYTDELSIHDNIIYDAAENLGIHVYRGLINGDIYNNTVYGNVTFKDVQGKVNFHNNDLYDGVLDGILTEYHLDRDFELNTIETYENSYTNYTIQLDSFKKIIQR